MKTFPKRKTFQIQACVWEAAKGTNQAQGIPTPPVVSVTAEIGHVPLNRVSPSLFFTLQFLLVQQPNELL